MASTLYIDKFSIDSVYVDQISKVQHSGLPSPSGKAGTPNSELE